jgi:hypothetical protein
MATKQQDKQSAVAVKEDHRQQDAVIGNGVIRVLGHPPGLHQVQVRRLWGDHYRVNIFVGPDAASARIAHSFFLDEDAEGNISTSNPKITKQY